MADETTDAPHRDPQDQAFGAAAARDEERVNELEDEGVDEEELPDRPDKHPRAAGKAEPDDEAGTSVSRD